MDAPSHRTLHLLSLLQTGGEWSVPDLAARLAVSPRTVRRDAQRLRDLGYDVRSRPGPGAAYRLRPGTRIPPLLLDADDVTTIITGLLVLEAWSPEDPAAAVARGKIEQVLPPGLRRRAAATALSTQILRAEPAPAEWAAVGTLADAVAQDARVAFAYTDQHDRASERVIAPHHHIFRGGRWYVVGFDIDRDDWRLFRLDRMREVRALPGVFAPREFPFASVEEWLTSDFGRSGS
ncbi:MULTISPECIES: YafY family protein [unclassified Microbacterium]|uniref:helix-turn-helix transcriptional regulator n=1 Tax=unclassified Microbacterium TaxID=2609290 RepID=UPI0021A6EDDD|nr:MULTISPECIES: WYL domain-containing protein [unclassified Microbacterium]MCT1363565.1 WYL domain-containing protein [Microbacterium sp. p3-SID131]MCT1375526.1 WYL domain-containing protein [Microbacterium sp. p3-SID337]